jgi:RNA polymerase sigma-70 factor (ECF subfamily)
LTGNRNDAEPIVQEVFVTVFEELDRFREDSQFWTWLIRITLDQPLMKLPDEQAEEEWFHDHHSLSEAKHLPVNVTDWAPNVEELYRPTELAGILRRALQELSPGLRMIFVLRDIAGLSLEQTAEATGLSLHAVKIRSMKGRLHLRDGLSKWFHQE